MVGGLDRDAAALEVFHCVGAEFFVEHAEDFGGDVVDCYLGVGVSIGCKFGGCWVELRRTFA